jgi:hypothetical protein
MLSALVLFINYASIPKGQSLATLNSRAVCREGQGRA